MKILQRVLFYVCMLGTKLNSLNTPCFQGSFGAERFEIRISFRSEVQGHPYFSVPVPGFFSCLTSLPAHFFLAGLHCGMY